MLVFKCLKKIFIILFKQKSSVFIVTLRKFSLKASFFLFFIVLIYFYLWIFTLKIEENKVFGILCFLIEKKVL